MALSANRTLDLRNVQTMRDGYGVIATSSVIYKHALVCQEDDGLGVVPAADTATTVFLGLAKTGPLTGDGTEVCEYIYNIDAKLTSVGLSAGNIGALVFCLDDQKVTSTNSKGPVAGPMVHYESTNLIWVWLRGPASAKASS